MPRCPSRCHFYILVACVHLNLHRSITITGLLDFWDEPPVKTPECLPVHQVKKIHEGKNGILV
eukprot:276820-Pelagomonas_calceolata.AAC.1